MAHGKGCTGHSKDVLDIGKMAASLQKVPATASLMHTSRVDQRHEGGCGHTESGAQAQRERRKWWRRVIDPGPPLHPEGDGSLCTRVVLPKTS